MKYRLVNGKLVDQPDNVVPRVYPTYSSNPKSTNFGLYCKYQLLRYKPWKNKQEDAWGNQEHNNDVFTSQWKVFCKQTMQNNMCLIGMENWKTYNLSAIMNKIKIT